MQGKKCSIDDYRSIAIGRGIQWVGTEIPSNIMKRTEWRCLACNRQWFTSFHNIKNGTECKSCILERQRYSEAEYIEYAKGYDFRYVGGYSGSTLNPVTWMCLSGHEWNACFSSIRNGTRCPICAGTQKKTEFEYRQLATKRGIEYIEGYTGNVKDNVKWKCSKNHIFSSSYDKLSNNNHGCNICAHNRTKEEYEYYQLAEKVGIEYLGGYTGGVLRPVKWKCSNGHTWSARYDNIRSGKRCPVCSESHGERTIAAWLEERGIKFEREKMFSTCRDKRKLPFDFCFSVSGIDFLCEYDGIQHFKETKYYSSTRLEGVKRRDSIKSKWASDNGYSLIRVPYTVKDVGGFLSEKIQEHVNKGDL